MRFATSSGLLGRLASAVVMVAMLAVGLMFSVVVLAVALVVGVCVFGYFWWKTRALRQAMRVSVPPVAADEGSVFEGEAVVVESWPRIGRNPEQTAGDASDRDRDWPHR